MRVKSLLCAGVLCWYAPSPALSSDSAVRITKAPDLSNGQIASDQLVYCLPKQQVEVKLVFSVFKHTVCPPAKDMGKLDPDKFVAQGRTNPGDIYYEAVLMKAPTIDLISVPDEKLKFAIVVPQLNGLTTDTTASLKFPNGILASAGTTFDDKIPSIVTHVANTAINVGATAGKFAAAMVATDGSEIDDADKSHEVIEYVQDVTLIKRLDLETGKVKTALADPEEKKDKPDKTKSKGKTEESSDKKEKTDAVKSDKKSKNLMPADKQIANNALLQEWIFPSLSIAANTQRARIELTDDSSMPPVIGSGSTLCPDRDLMRTTDAELIRAAILAGGVATKDLKVHKSPVAESQIQIDLPKHLYFVVRDPETNEGIQLTTIKNARGEDLEDVDRFTAFAHKNGKGMRFYDGIVVRAPRLVKLSLWNLGESEDRDKGQLCFEDSTYLAQTGGFLKLGMKKKGWAKSSTTIDLTGSGAVSSFGSSHTSPIESFTKVLDDVSSTLSKAVP